MVKDIQFEHGYRLGFVDSNKVIFMLPGHCHSNLIKLHKWCNGSYLIHNLWGSPPTVYESWIKFKMQSLWCEIMFYCSVTFKQYDYLNVDESYSDSCSICLYFQYLTSCLFPWTVLSAQPPVLHSVLPQRKAGAGGSSQLQGGEIWGHTPKCKSRW